MASRHEIETAPVLHVCFGPVGHVDPHACSCGAITAYDPDDEGLPLPRGTYRPPIDPDELDALFEQDRRDRDQSQGD